MLGLFGDRLESRGVEGIYCCPEREDAPTNVLKPLNQLLEQEWAELPYTMMRIAGATRSQGGKRFYWRDQCVQCGDIELDLIRSQSEGATFTYTAIYSREGNSLNDHRRDLLVPLQPSLEGNQLRWSAPGICDTADLTSEELAEVLLAKLTTFSANELRTDGPFLSQ
jgi:hypothetical protein